MIKQYIKQALVMLKENPILSIISITGTALAIAMIMVLVIAYEVQTANYYPETNRDRTLYIHMGQYVEDQMQGTSRTSFPLIKECFYPLAKAEAVTAVSPLNLRLLSIPAGENEYKAETIFTDERFWKVFDFRFLSGAPFTEEDVQSGIRKAVINETMARSLYGSIDIIGNTLLVSYTKYTVCGVVPDVSTLAEMAYAELWIPHTTVDIPPSDWTNNVLGRFSCFILAHSKDDFTAIQQEAERNVQQFNKSLPAGEYQLNDQPDTHFVQIIREDEKAPDIPHTIIRYAAVLIILLLIPAINLSSMTLSRMRKRLAEIGVRKAFGATQQNLIYQILSENLVLTILGGIVGLGISYIAIITMNELLLERRMDAFRDGIASLNSDMIVNPAIFIYAFLFCLALNLLSAGIPAWRASRENIVNALNEIE